MRLKYYVGCLKDSTEYEVFSSRVEPTDKTVEGRYTYSIGPFHRKMDAVDFVEHKHYLSPILVLSSSFRACKKD
jgi:hypothetical protein